MKTRFIFVIGATNVGKTTLMDAVKAQAHPEHATIEIGRRMRAKYPPEHFQGQSNPKHTAEEAWAWFVEEATAHQKMGKRFVWVDGQPRDLPQADAIHFGSWDNGGCYLHLYCREEVRRQRALSRDADPHKRELSLARLSGDIPSLYGILCHLQDNRKIVLSANTEQKDAVYIIARTIAHLT